jgi:molybdopterin-guanine dinucleotide biosynthesis protein A
LPNILNEIKKENYKLNYILKISKTLFVDFDEEESFFNINYIKDYGPLASIIQSRLRPIYGIKGI